MYRASHKDASSTQYNIIWIQVWLHYYQLQGANKYQYYSPCMCCYDIKIQKPNPCSPCFFGTDCSSYSVPDSCFCRQDEIIMHHERVSELQRYLTNVVASLRRYTIVFHWKLVRSFYMKKFITVGGTVRTFRYGKLNNIVRTNKKTLYFNPR